MNRPQKRPPKEALYSPCPGKAAEPPKGLSPLLRSLLMLVYSDGLANRTAFAMLRDICPYVTADDRRIIAPLLEARQAAEQLCPPPVPTPRAWTFCRALGRQERLCGLLNVLGRYGGKRSQDIFSMLERAIRLQSRLERQQGGGMDALLPLLGELGGANLSSMGPLLQMLGGKGGIDASLLSSLFSATGGK
ncbi:MAG: hypothetical protein IJP03_00825 [Christensenellaceae bacterium]|nr:hypothetical protein [Christensenellaceae bacterium]